MLSPFSMLKISRFMSIRSAFPAGIAGATHLIFTARGTARVGCLDGAAPMEPRIFTGRMCGKLNGRVVHADIAVHIVNGKSSWFVNGEPLVWATDPRLVARTHNFLDVVGGTRVLFKEQVEEVFEGVYTLAIQPNALELIK